MPHLTLAKVQKHFEQIGWVVERNHTNEARYSLWSNEHAPSEEYLCDDLRDVMSYYQECKTRSQ